MHARISIKAMLTVVAAVAIAVPAVAAEKKRVEVVNSYSGSVADEKLQKEAPVAIVSKAGLEKVWKEYKLDAKLKVPETDFTKEIYVVITDKAAKVRIGICVLDEKGNLEAPFRGEGDARGGFGYVLAVVPREGIKTINGKELPKE